MPTLIYNTIITHIYSVIIGALSDVVSSGSTSWYSSISVSLHRRLSMKCTFLVSVRLFLRWAFFTDWAPSVGPCSRLLLGKKDALLPEMTWKKETCSVSPLSGTQTEDRAGSQYDALDSLGWSAFFFLLNMKLKNPVTTSITPVKYRQSFLIHVNLYASVLIIWWNILLFICLLNNKLKAPGITACHASTGCRKHITDIIV